MSDIVRVCVAVIELSGCFSASSIRRLLSTPAVATVLWSAHHTCCCCCCRCCYRSVVCSSHLLLSLLLPFCGLLITLAAVAVVAVP